MKILEISSAPVSFNGGTEKVVLELSKDLSKKHEVTILQTTLYEQDKKSGVEKNGNLKIITCKNDYFAKGFGYSLEFKNVLKKIYKNFDLIHIHGHGRFTSTYALRFLKYKKPIIYTAHGFFHTSASGKIKKIYNFIFSKIKNGVSIFIALTPLEEKEYVRLGIKKEKVVILPNWVNLREFKATKKKKYFSNSYPVLFCVGRIHESKGMQFVLEAIKNLKVNFLIAGRDVGYLKTLKQIVKSQKIEKRVKFLGEISDGEKRKAYSSSDFFVLFSEWEGFGIVVLEALAYGLPTIVSNKGALPYLIQNKKNGIIAKFPNVNDLREKINLLLKDKKLNKILYKNSKEFIKKFDSKIIIKEYEKLYGKAIHDFKKKKL